MESGDLRRPGDGPAAATQDDVRGLRRWVMVAGVWAVAATAVALIALLDNSQDEASKRAVDAEQRSAEVERKLGERLDGLEGRLDDVPQARDVSNLGVRLKRAEDRAAAAEEEAGKADSGVNDLEERIEQLERDAPAADDGGGDDDSP